MKLSQQDYKEKHRENINQRFNLKESVSVVVGGAFGFGEGVA